MPRKVQRHSHPPSVSGLASTAALESVFAHPDIRPMDLDLDLLVKDPASIPVPGPDDEVGALAMGLALALQVHEPPEGEEARFAKAAGIANLLVRLAKDHPAIAMHAADAAGGAHRVEETGPAAGGRSLIIPVVTHLAQDPGFAKMIEDRYT